MAERYLKRREVQEMVGLSRSAIYRLMNERLFPIPIKIGPRAVRWPLSELKGWLADRERALDPPHQDGG